MSVERIKGWLERNPQGGPEPIHPDDLRALLAARAEAQDEGAAGEPVGPPREPTQTMMDALLYHSSHDTTWADAYTMWTNAHDAWFRDGAAHPSPTPAADADRVLDEAAKYLKAQYGASYGLDHPKDRAHILAALKSEGK